MEQSPSHTVIGVADGSWRLPFAASLPAGAKALLVARPEAMRLDAPGNGSVTGRVVERRFTGANAYYTVQLSDGRSIEVEGLPEAARPDTVVGIEPAERGLHLFPLASDESEQLPVLASRLSDCCCSSSGSSSIPSSWC
jgi:ABC-type Fe3+/spermidine/putrescine transport system ATPase subunit